MSCSDFLLFTFHFPAVDTQLSFNLIDFLLVVLILLSVLNGWRRGFILGLLDLLGWVLSLLAALRFYQPVARWIGAHVDRWSEIWDQPIAFVLVALLAGLAIRLLSYALLKRLNKDVH